MSPPLWVKDARSQAVADWVRERYISAMHKRGTEHSAGTDLEVFAVHFRLGDLAQDFAVATTGAERVHNGNLVTMDQLDEVMEESGMDYDPEAAQRRKKKVIDQCEVEWTLGLGDDDQCGDFAASEKTAQMMSFLDDIYAGRTPPNAWEGFRERPLRLLAGTVAHIREIWDRPLKLVLLTDGHAAWFGPWMRRFPDTELHAGTGRSLVGQGEQKADLDILATATILLRSSGNLGDTAMEINSDGVKVGLRADFEAIPHFTVQDAVYVDPRDGKVDSESLFKARDNMRSISRSRGEL